MPPDFCKIIFSQGQGHAGYENPSDELLRVSLGSMRTGKVFRAAGFPQNPKHVRVSLAVNTDDLSESHIMVLSDSFLQFLSGYIPLLAM